MLNHQTRHSLRYKSIIVSNSYRGNASNMSKQHSLWVSNTYDESNKYIAGASSWFDTGTILPAKSDSDVMFCLQSYQGLIIDKSLVY